ncbi:class I SAM-dependent methyltransferase [Pectobacterium brasiliense]|uniref:class I SAM-dependent methyltransferase n=1 Tax=Pectobacterium brasiliense TaxID=180957 RepID=UPI001968C5E3|nr:class I SAM-dependent methyltransferase [Pectobacterium brasiliense]MBN3262337.1 class I SAM-dependent methyltransferase [Pectobacterium brasiliense]
MKNSKKTLDCYNDQLLSLLNSAYFSCEKGNYFFAFKYLGEKLTRLYDNIDKNDLDDIRAVARNHPIFNICQQAPYTNRAFTKPRGYPGDAEMIDYIYYGIVPPQTTLHGKGIFSCTTRDSMGLSVLFRRTLLNAYINDTVIKNQSARILSVASGHCRELSDSLVLSDIFKGEIIAFDQDKKSCSKVEMVYQNRVKTINLGVKNLWGTAKYELGKFDFIYSAGLYDYLSEAQALKLSESLKLMLKPDGRLVIGDFSPTSTGRGYLDLMMDWSLIYRNKQELSHLFGDLTGFSIYTYNDPHHNVVYVEIIRNG